LSGNVLTLDFERDFPARRSVFGAKRDGAALLFNVDRCFAGPFVNLDVDVDFFDFDVKRRSAAVRPRAALID
jgi:hypothetical protein